MRATWIAKSKTEGHAIVKNGNGNATTNWQSEIQVEFGMVYGGPESSNEPFEVLTYLCHKAAPHGR